MCNTAPPNQSLNRTHCGGPPFGLQSLAQMPARRNVPVSSNVRPQNMTLVAFVEEKLSQWRKPVLDPKSFAVLKYRTKIIPLQYLEYAEKDLRLGGNRGHINALPNAKRAIDCEIFTVLAALGVPEPRTFPGRLEALKSLGLVAPKVIRKIVQLRNVLEHEYHLPTSTEVQDAVDVATLFLAAFKPYHSGGQYLESTWVADESSVNPRGVISRTETHTTWDHTKEPRYTFSRGVFIESHLETNEIELNCIHDNIEIVSRFITQKDRGYLELQGLLLRAEVDNIVHTRKGANLFIKAIRAIAV